MSSTFYLTQHRRFFFTVTAKLDNRQGLGWSETLEYTFDTTSFLHFSIPCIVISDKFNFTDWSELSREESFSSEYSNKNVMKLSNNVEVR